MASTPVTHRPLVITNCQVIIDGKAYGDAIDSAVAQASYSSHDWKPVSGKAQTITGALSWKVTLNLGQDYTMDSLTHQLLTRHGQQAELTLAPAGEAEGQPTITGIVTLAAVTDLGGKGDEIATTGTTMGFLGQPDIKWAAAPDAAAPAAAAAADFPAEYQD